MADAVSTLPFTTEFQVKPGRMGVIAGWGDEPLSESKND